MNSAFSFSLIHCTLKIVLTLGSRQTHANCERSGAPQKPTLLHPPSPILAVSPSFCFSHHHSLALRLYLLDSPRRLDTVSCSITHPHRSRVDHGLMSVPVHVAPPGQKGSPCLPFMTHHSLSSCYVLLSLVPLVLSSSTSQLGSPASLAPPQPFQYHSSGSMQTASPVLSGLTWSLANLIDGSVGLMDSVLHTLYAPRRFFSSLPSSSTLCLHYDHLSLVSSCHTTDLSILSALLVALTLARYSFGRPFVGIATQL